MKILAKRKRGNKFPLEGKLIFGQLKSKQMRKQIQGVMTTILDVQHSGKRGNKHFLMNT